MVYISGSHPGVRVPNPEKREYNSFFYNWHTIDLLVFYQQIGGSQHVCCQVNYNSLLSPFANNCRQVPVNIVDDEFLPVKKEQNSCKAEPDGNKNDVLFVEVQLLFNHL
jgi:hypothetical protein